MPPLATQASNAYPPDRGTVQNPAELDRHALCDGALRFLARARGAIEQKNIPRAAIAISRTLAIVSELQARSPSIQAAPSPNRWTGCTSTSRAC